MEIEPGYKLTEVGVIPEDWAVMALGAVCETSSGTTPSRALMDRYYKNGTIAWVKTLDLNNSDIHTTGENVTELALKETCLRSYPAGTVLVAMYGGFNQIGRTGLLRRPATVNQALTAIRPDKSVLVSEYLIRNLNYRVDYWKRVASSSRKDPNITSKDIRNFPIALPAAHEQAAIAGALSDADALIGSLEQLIAKKRDLKQGAMQELLTGKRRLPGFANRTTAYKRTEVGVIPEDWSVKRVGNLTVTVASGISHVDSEFGEYPVYGSTGIIGRCKQNDYSGRAILIARVGANAGKLSVVDGEYGVTDNTIIIRVDGSCHMDYFWRQLEAQRLNSHVFGSGQPLITGTQIKNLGIPLAPTKHEQAAIATVLSDMDTEIATLVAKLAKARDLKQGMMHNLLTGKIRLV